MASANQLVFHLIIDTKKGTAKIKETGQAISKVATDGSKQMSGLARSFSNVAKVGERIFFLFSGFRMVQSAVSGLIEKSNMQEEAEKKVEQAVRSTGMAAGFTSDQLIKMASGLQKITTFGDEQILTKVTTQLLTFTNIQGEAFERAQKAVLDLSTVLNGDLQAAAIMVGKALNDPVATLGQLSRAGIQFSKEQKKLIKDLWETGQKAKAQALILDELNKEYGGQAEAIAKLPAGKLKQFSNIVGDLKEKIGDLIKKALLPIISILQPLVNFLNKMDTATFEFAATLTAFLAIGLKLVPMFQAWNLQVKLLGVSIKSALGWIGIFVTAATLIYQAWATNLGGFQEKLKIAFEYLKWFISYGTELIKGYAKMVWNYFGGIGKILISAFTLNVDGIKKGLEQAKAAILNSVIDTSSKLEELTKKRDENIQRIHDDFASKEINLNKNKDNVILQHKQRTVSEMIILDKQALETQKALLEHLKQFANKSELEKAEFIKKVDEEQTRKRTDLLIQFYGKIQEVHSKEADEYEKTQQRELEAFKTTREQMDEFMRGFNEGFLSTAQEMADFLVQQRQMEMEDKLKSLEIEFSKRKENLNKELKLGHITEQEYKKRLKRLNEEEQKRTELLRKEARKRSAFEKMVVIASIMEHTYDAAMRAYDWAAKWGGPIAGAIAAGIATAFGLAQVASARSVRAFAKGGKVEEPTLGLVGESGTEIIAPERDFKQVVSDYLQGESFLTGLGNILSQFLSKFAEQAQRFSAIQTKQITQNLMQSNETGTVSTLLQEIKAQIENLNLSTEISGDDLAILVSNGQKVLKQGEISG